MKRDLYLRVVDERQSDARLFAPLTDSLFAASASGKQWVSDTTVEDQVQAAAQCGYAAGFVRGSTPDLFVNPALTGWVETKRMAASDTERQFTQTIQTPNGTLTRTLVEQPGNGIQARSEWVEDASQFPAVEWMIGKITAGERDAVILEHYTAFAEKAATAGVSQVQLELPYFLFGLPGFSAGPLMMAMDEDSGYVKLMQQAEEAVLHVAGLLLRAGVDFVWIGAGGTELLSPDIWERIVIPQSKRIVEHVRALGGRTHFHCCGQSKLWIEKGYFNEIGMDLVETMSPPPAGTVDDLKRARSLIDRAIVTRGNIDLGLILNGAPEECANSACEVMEATAGYPHLIGSADAILYGTPTENLAAIRETVEG